MEGVVDGMNTRTWLSAYSIMQFRKDCAVYDGWKARGHVRRHQLALASQMMLGKAMARFGAEWKVLARDNDGYACWRPIK